MERTWETLRALRREYELVGARVSEPSLAMMPASSAGMVVPATTSRMWLMALITAMVGAKGTCG